MNAPSNLMDRMLDTPPHPTGNYMVERAFVFVANVVGVLNEGCMSFHARFNGEDPKMVVVVCLKEDSDAMLLGFDDGEGQLI